MAPPILCSPTAIHVGRSDVPASGLTWLTVPERANARGRWWSNSLVARWRAVTALTLMRVVSGQTLADAGPGPGQGRQAGRCQKEFPLLWPSVVRWSWLAAPRRLPLAVVTGAHRVKAVGRQWATPSCCLILAGRTDRMASGQMSRKTSGADRSRLEGSEAAVGQSPTARSERRRQVRRAAYHAVNRRPSRETPALRPPAAVLRRAMVIVHQVGH